MPEASMKQLVILSGKGGTGKTSMAAAFAHLAHDGQYPLQAVLADADVDAANLELVLCPERIETHDFTGGSIAMIDQERCDACGICEQVCRFDAIQSTTDSYRVDPIACDGCAACVYQCPEKDIQMQPQTVGQWYCSDSCYGPLYHADLFPAQENSGKLVTVVKQNARLLALDTNSQVVIVDGPPGIGCPVIAAAAGADMALIVTEPSVAGIHDLRRALQTTSHFRIPTQVVINKADIYPEGTAQIETECVGLGVEVIGIIPFDPAVTEAMLNGEAVTIYRPESPASKAFCAIWETVVSRLVEIGENS
jgi:MinD superfamily P-loop ATPase